MQCEMKRTLGQHPLAGSPCRARYDSDERASARPRLDLLLHLLKLERSRPLYLPPDRCKASSAPSIEKLPGFWLGGNSLKVPRNCATYCCAGTITNRCSTRQRL